MVTGTPTITLPRQWAPRGRSVPRRFRCWGLMALGGCATCNTSGTPPPEKGCPCPGCRRTRGFSCVGREHVVNTDARKPLAFRAGGGGDVGGPPHSGKRRFDTEVDATSSSCAGDRVPWLTKTERACRAITLTTAGGFVSTVFVHQVDVTAEVLHCAKSSKLRGRGDLVQLRNSASRLSGDFACHGWLRHRSP